MDNNRLTSFLLLLALVVAIGVTGTYLVVEKMHSEALAVMTGIICGVGAALPVSLLVLYASRRSQRPAEVVTPTPPAQPQQPAPQIFVLGGLPPGMTPPGYAPGLPSPQDAWQARPPERPATRNFTILGDDDD